MGSNSDKSNHSGGIRRLLELYEGAPNMIRGERQKLEKQYIGTKEYQWIDSIFRKKELVARRRTRASLIRKGNFTKEQWLEILKSQKNRCKYCNKEFSKENLATIDHIIPINSHLSGMGTYKGKVWYKVRKVRGAHTKKNIVAACRSCNATKNAHPPRELLFKITNSRIKGGKSQNVTENFQKIPISRVRGWYIKNTLKLIAKKPRKRIN